MRVSVDVTGMFIEKDQILFRAGSDNEPATIAPLMRLMDIGFASAMQDGFKNVETDVQHGKSWMIVSFNNNTLGEELWRLAIQFHNFPDEKGPQVVGRLRYVYTEEPRPGDYFDDVSGAVTRAMTQAAGLAGDS